jgi:hypothetical protein
MSWVLTNVRLAPPGELISLSRIKKQFWSLHC